MLFASDAPFGAEGGASYIRETMKVLASLDISTADKEKLCYRNAQALFKLSDAGCSDARNLPCRPDRLS